MGTRLSPAAARRRAVAVPLAVASAAALASLVWVGWTPATVDVTPASRVLVLGGANWPAVTGLPDFLDRLRSAPGMPPTTTVEFVEATSDAQIEAAVSRRAGQWHRYRAIYVPSLSLARAVQQQVGSVPIVFEGADDAIATCLADSPRRPGRNATGYMHYLDDAELRMLQVLKDAFPDLQEVLVAVSAGNLRVRDCRTAAQAPGVACSAGLHGADATTEALIEGERLAAYARRLGLGLQFYVTCSEQDFDDLARLAAARPASAVLVPWQNLFAEHEAELVTALSRSRRPTIGARLGYARAGGLFALEPVLPVGDVRESHRLLAEVLRGRAPADLPVSSPAGYSLVFNARTAGALGLRPRLAVIARADQVLQ